MSAGYRPVDARVEHAAREVANRAPDGAGDVNRVSTGEESGLRKGGNSTETAKRALGTVHMLRTSGQSAQVRLTLSAGGGVVIARATTEPSAAPLAKATAPPIGSLIYGHPKLRKPSGYRGDYELGLLTKRGSAATGDGDISYILWLQRLWVRGEAEQNQTVETDERWPSSSMWSRTAVVGHCASLDGGAAGGGTPGHLVTRWDADAGAFFARADAEACARSTTNPAPTTP